MCTCFADLSPLEPQLHLSLQQLCGVLGSRENQILILVLQLTAWEALCSLSNLSESHFVRRQREGSGKIAQVTSNSKLMLGVYTASYCKPWGFNQRQSISNAENY